MGSTLVRIAALVVTGGLLAHPAIADGHLEQTRLPVAMQSSHAPLSVVQVEKGDHLWRIARHHLETVLGREAAEHETAAYWRLVVEHNRNGLRSGKPDLIYPGEVIALPLVSGQP